MNEEKCYEQYPWWIVLASNLVSVSIYALGAVLMGHFGLFSGILYLVYCAWVESRVLRGSCVACYYYGKRCAFGKGLVCSWIFKPGEPNQCSKRKISWKDILPDFMVVIIPAGVGVILLLVNFHWTLLFQFLALLLLFCFGNGWIRGSLACPFCKKRLLGCPALELFEKK